MGQELTTHVEMEAPDYGPKMLELAPLQQKLVLAYLSHPTWSASALAIEAGYAQSSAPTRGSINLRDPRVIAAINEEGERAFVGTGPAIALMGFLKLALNEGHKDHFRALEAIANRTGHHAMSEHKVTVDDKRPQSKAELIAAIKNFGVEMKIDPAFVAQLTGEKVIDGEFTEMPSSAVYIPAEDDAVIAKEMEDL